MRRRSDWPKRIRHWNSTLGEPISLSEYALIVLGTSAAGGIYIWPRSLSIMAGQNACLALIGNCLWGVVMLIVTVRWALATPGHTAPEKLRHSFGAFGMWLMVGCLLLISISYLAMLFLLYLLLMMTIITPGGQLWTLGLVFAGFLIWLNSRPLINLVRLLTLTIPVVGVMTTLGGLLGLNNVHYPQALLPHLPIHPTSLFDAIITTAYLWIPTFSLASAVPLIRPANRSQAIRITRTSAIILTGFLMGLYALTVSTIGPQGASHATWPVVFVFENITVYNFFVSDIGFLVALSWSISFIGFMAWNIWHLGVMIESLGRQRTTHIGSTLVMALVAGIVILGNLIGLNVLVVENWLIDILSPFYFGIATIWSTMLLMLWWRRWRQSRPRTDSAHA